MSNFNIVLSDEAGRTKEADFETLEECAAFALKYPEYGILLYGDYDQREWKREFDCDFCV